jgi:hypothetical protein
MGGIDDQRCESCAAADPIVGVSQDDILEHVTFFAGLQGAPLSVSRHAKDLVLRSERQLVRLARSGRPHGLCAVYSPADPQPVNYHTPGASVRRQGTRNQASMRCADRHGTATVNTEQKRPAMIRHRRQGTPGPADAATVARAAPGIQATAGMTNVSEHT